LGELRSPRALHAQSSAGQWPGNYLADTTAVNDGKEPSMAAWRHRLPASQQSAGGSPFTSFSYIGYEHTGSMGRDDARREEQLESSSTAACPDRNLPSPTGTNVTEFGTPKRPRTTGLSQPRTEDDHSNAATIITAVPRRGPAVPGMRPVLNPRPLFIRPSSVPPSPVRGNITRSVPPSPASLLADQSTGVNLFRADPTASMSQGYTSHLGNRGPASPEHVALWGWSPLPGPYAAKLYSAYAVSPNTASSTLTPGSSCSGAKLQSSTQVANQWIEWLDQLQQQQQQQQFTGWKGFSSRPNTPPGYSFHFDIDSYMRRAQAAGPEYYARAQEWYREMLEWKQRWLQAATAEHANATPTQTTETNPEVVTASGRHSPVNGSLSNGNRNGTSASDSASSKCSIPRAAHTAKTPAASTVSAGETSCANEGN
jgi:hypothetical protein